MPGEEGGWVSDAGDYAMSPNGGGRRRAGEGGGWWLVKRRRNVEGSYANGCDEVRGRCVDGDHNVLRRGAVGVTTAAGARRSRRKELIKLQVSW